MVLLFYLITVIVIISVRLTGVIMSMFRIPSSNVDGQRALRPMFEAKAGYNDVSLLQKIGLAVGTVLSNMGSMAFAAGMAIVAIFLIPVSLGALETAVLAYPAYLALAGGAALLGGEVAKHMSEKQVAHLTFSA